MKIVKRDSTFFLTAVLSFFMASGIAGSGQDARAESEQALLVQAVTDLTELRDRLADHWTQILKSGWDVYVDDKLIFSDLEKTPANFKPWLDVVPPGDWLKVEGLTYTLKQIPAAEKAFMASIHNSRNAVAQGLLNMITVSELGLSVMSKTDELVLGRNQVEFIALPPATMDGANLEKLSTFGFKPDPNIDSKGNPLENSPADSKEAEWVPLPAGSAGKKPLPDGRTRQDHGPQRIEPSTDPEMLRLAYEAGKAYQLFRYQTMSAVYEIQMEMAGFGAWGTHFDCRPQAMAELMGPLHRLPGLAPREIKAIEDLPEFCTRMMGELNIAKEAQARKQQAQADLGRLVETSLGLIDELRAYYLKRLLESGS